MNGSYPKKNMASAALIFNQRNQLLIVKPNYMNYWHLPGGIVEKDESPYNACIREVFEEINLELKPKKLSVVHHSRFEKENVDALVFIFYCGKITENQANAICIPYDELESYKFVDFCDIFLYLDERMAQITKECTSKLDDQKTLYMENMKCIL